MHKNLWRIVLTIVVTCGVLGLALWRSQTKTREAGSRATAPLAVPAAPGSGTVSPATVAAPAETQATSLPPDTSAPPTPADRGAKAAPASASPAPMAGMMSADGADGGFTPGVVMDRYATNAVLDERVGDLAHDGTYERVRVVRTDGKYPLVRVVERMQGSGAGEQRLYQTAMAADHVTLKVREGVTEAQLAAVAQANGGTILRKLRVPGPGTYLVRFPDVTVDTVPRALAVLGRQVAVVEHVEPDHVVYALDVTPNDPRFGELWGLNNTSLVTQAAEAFVATTNWVYTAVPLTYAGSTPITGVSAVVYSCGLGGPGDFPVAVAGNIALIQRGTYLFSDKVANAMRAGAVAAVIYNNAAGMFNGTLNDASNWIPAVAMSQADGIALSDSLSGGLLTATVISAVESNAASRADIRAPAAWEFGTGSSNIVVGVIDTGVYYNHEDLLGNMWRNAGEIPGNGMDDDGNGFVDDVYGYDFCNNDADPLDDHSHGTHCSGTIGGIGNNAKGVAGVCWKVRIMALKFISASGSGYTSDAIEAVYYATRMGARLTSNSWGGGGFNSLLRDAITNAGASNVLFVAAAGNAGTDNDQTPTYPATYDLTNLIAVAATDASDGLASFSCYGRTTVDLGAPGVNILSCVVPGSSYDTSGTGYTRFSGTSMATPHVAGAMALLMAQFPALSAAEIRQTILDATDPIAALEGKTVTGGRLNAANAARSATEPILRLTAYTVAEDALGGNGDGFINPGERVAIAIVVKNASQVDAAGVQATLATANPVVTVASNTLAIGSLPAGAVVTNGLFLVDVGPDIPILRYPIVLRLTLRDGNGRESAASLALTIHRRFVLSGVVRDAVTLQPVSNAVVECVQKDGQFARTAHTDGVGAYSMGLVSSDYRVRADAAGYLPSPTLAFRLPPDRQMDFNLSAGHVEIVDLGNTDEYGEPTGLNNYGVVVGKFFNMGVNYWRPFLWSNGVLQLNFVNPPMNYNNWAAGINDAGQVAGTWGTPGSWCWFNGVVTTNFWPADATFCEAFDIAQDGTMCGDYSASSGGYFPVIWTNRTPAIPWGLAGKDSGMAYGNNDVGQTVGYVGPALSGNGAFLDDDGTPVYIGTTGDYDGIGKGNEVNNFGQVVGFSQTGEPMIDGYDLRRPFLWENGIMQMFDVLSEDYSGFRGEALDINDRGQVVGFFNSKGAQVNHAWLWENGGYTDLNNMIPTGSGWTTLNVATRINEVGQIVGYGSNTNGGQRCFLMTFATTSNRPPWCLSSRVTTPEDTPVTVTLAGRDLDADPLVFAVLTPPAHGRLTGTPPALTYMPDTNYFGRDHFTFSATDGKYGSARGKIALVVTPVQDAPIVSNLTVTALADMPCPITPPAMDPEGDAMTFTVASQPANGTVSGAPDTLVYHPRHGFAGTDAFTFRASDGIRTSGTATITITVQGANHPPVALDRRVTTVANTPVAVTLAAVDPDGDAVTFERLGEPQHGALTGQGAALTYTPAPGYQGTDGFAYRAQDVAALGPSAWVRIDVLSAASNAPPVAAFGVSLPPVTPFKAWFDATASSDSDGTLVSYDWNFGDGVLGAGPAVTHTYAAPGNYVVTLVVRDNAGASATTNAQVIANATPAVAVTFPTNGARLAEGAILLEANPTDGDSAVRRVEFFGDGRAVATLESPPWRAIWSGVLTGTHTVKARVTDAQGATAWSSNVSFRVDLFDWMESLGSSREVKDINDRDWVIYKTFSDGVSYLRMDNVTKSVVGMGAGSGVHELNNRGQVAGQISIPSSSQYPKAFLWETNGTMTIFDWLFPTNNWPLQAQGMALNNAGKVVGNCTYPPRYGGMIPETHPTVWEKGKPPLDLDPRIGGEGFGYAKGINDLDVVCGIGADYNNGFMYDLKTGTYTPLPSLGSGASWGNAINNRGLVVGQSKLPAYDGIEGWRSPYHPVVWLGGEILDIGTFGGHAGRLDYVNDRGQAAGYASSYYESLYFLWQYGIPKRPITDLIPLADRPNWSGIITVNGINNRGSVIGHGKYKGTQGAYLMHAMVASNLAPVVNAGPDRAVLPGRTATLAGQVWDDGLPWTVGAVTSLWTVVSGPGPVRFGNAAAAATSAGMDVPGTYVLRLAAFDGERQGQDETTVLVSDGSDADGNGLPDDWERYYFGATGLLRGRPDADWDGDGHSNGDEHTAGTDPTDPSSMLRISGIASGTNADVVVWWNSAWGRRYTLVGRSNLLDGAWLPVAAATDLAGSPPLNTVTTRVEQTPNNFYRLNVTLEP